MKKLLKSIKNCSQALDVMYQSQYSYRASSLAFSTLLSLVPIISVFVFIMTQAPIFSKLNHLAKNYVLENFVPTSSQEILTYLDKFTHQASQLPIFSIIFLFMTSTLLVITIDKSMNSIWHKQARKRNFLSLIIYPLIVLSTPIFIVAIALFSSFLFFLSTYFPEAKVISFAIPLAINTLMLSILYNVTANKKIHWHDTFLGSIVASTLLEICKIGFAVYVNHFSNYNAIYGALATIPILLLWLYIFWLIILYGAFIVKVGFQD